MSITMQELLECGMTGLDDNVKFVGAPEMSGGNGSCAIITKDNDEFWGTVHFEARGWHAWMHQVDLGKFPTKDLAGAAVCLAWTG